MDETEQQADQSPGRYVSIIGDIVSAYVSNNSVPPSELATLIASVHKAITALTSDTPTQEPDTELVPPVSIKKSLGHDFLISMEDGKPYKSLKRHVGTYGMTPDEYRTKWKLPRDYPMVAPSYSAARSELAKKSGLGAQSKGRIREPKKPAKTPPGKRGRPPKNVT